MTHYAPCSRQPRICCTVQLFFNYCRFLCNSVFLRKKKSKSYKSHKKNYKFIFYREGGIKLYMYYVLLWHGTKNTKEPNNNYPST